VAHTGALDLALVEKYRNQYGSGLEALTYLGQNYLSVDRSLIPTFCGGCARTSSSTTAST